MIRALFSLAFILHVTVALCQPVWVNKGALVLSNSGFISVANGSVFNDTGSFWSHSGQIDIHGNIENRSLLKIAGNMSVSGNWINHGTTEALSGSVSLNGSDQEIRGSSISHFPNLVLSGTGLKKLSQSATALGVNLNNLHLDTDTSELFLINMDAASLQRTTGYISSNSGGSFKRILNQETDYLFPVGSPSIYSPVKVKLDTGTDTVAVRFAGADASNEGLSRLFVEPEICKTNPLFYHLIEGTHTGSGTIKIYLPGTLANTWPSMAGRPAGGSETWKTLENLVYAAQDTFSQANISFENLSNSAYLLSRNRPAAPVITGPDEVCQFENSTYSVGVNAQETVSWSIAGGDIVSSGNEAEVLWGSTTAGVISAIISDGAGCSSFSTSKQVIIHELPEAAIGFEAPAFYFEDEVFRFYQQGEGANSYNWFIDNIQESTDSIMPYSFDGPGIYTIELVVKNIFGCTQTADTTIEIIEGLLIPDSFSPNGDGINDELNFKNSGLIKFNLNIYNRWGNLLFATNHQKLNWNGRNQAGELVSAGTYFFTLTAESGSKSYTKRGAIHVAY